MIAVKKSWLTLGGRIIALVCLAGFIGTIVYAVEIASVPTLNSTLVFAGDGAGNCGSKKTYVCNKKGDCKCVSNQKGCDISGDTDKNKCPPPVDNTGGIVACEGKDSPGHKDCAVNLINNNYVECTAGSNGAVQASCRQDASGNCYSPGDGALICGNSKYYCPKHSCNCQATSCPPSTPETKFMTTAVSNGTHGVCGSNTCSPTQAACPASFKNTPPTCSMLPKTIVIDRNAAPRAISLTVTDKDYGDTVQVTNVRVVDAQGSLKSCVKVTNAQGQTLENLIVKQGSASAGDISQVTDLLVDAATAHGVYASNGDGTSTCSGSLEVTITDLDLDGNGPDTSTPGVKCAVDVTVKNNDPVISNVQIHDKDPDISLRRAGNLLTQFNNSAPLPVGSPSNARRAATCANSLSLNPLGECAVADVIPKQTHTNPFEVSFNVGDGNGVNDLREIGIAIQSAASVNADPTVARNAPVSAILADTYRDFNIAGTRYFNSNACLGTGCTDSLLGDSATLFGHRLITHNDPVVSMNGNISVSTAKTSRFGEWLKVGFPDCLATAQGCSKLKNVPAVSKENATSDGTDPTNIIASVGADATHMICLPGNAATNYVVAKSSVCPLNCAACVSRESVTPAEGSNNILNVKFTVFLNDKNEGGAGILEGKYNLLLSAQDKVGGSANGNKYWLPISSGNNNGLFALQYDTTPPAITLNITNPPGTTLIDAAGNFRDSGTGVLGYTSRFLVREHYANAGDASGVLSFLTWDIAGQNDIAGKMDLVSFGNPRPAPTFKFTGRGVQSNDGLAAGICAYDAAGNSCCTQTIGSEIKSSCKNSGGTSGQYVYGGGWIQTSLGSVYSNTTGSGSAFIMTIPAASKNESPLIYAPFETQSGSAVSGFLVSNSSDIGIVGGRLFGSQAYPLGFSATASTLGNYRTDDASSPFNIFGQQTTDQSNWYAQIKGIATANCQLIGNCEQASDIKTGLESATAYKVGTITTTQTISDNIVCRGSSIIFIDGNAHITFLGQVTKATPQSACMFVVNAGSTLTIGDVARVSATSGAPQVDYFQASVIVSDGGSFGTTAPQTFRSNIVFDRLEMYGFLFSASKIAPALERSLNADNNKSYPSESFIYDANVLDVFRPLLGFQKTADLVCGTSGHVFCAK